MPGRFSTPMNQYFLLFFPIENEYYEVFLLDFGIYDVVHFKKFRKLHVHFSIYPVQCLPGKLMGIREQDVNKWARSVKSYFRDFIKNAENNNLLALVGPGNYVDQKVSI